MIASLKLALQDPIMSILAVGCQYETNKEMCQNY
jgi:hypothetical protein